MRQAQQLLRLLHTKEWDEVEKLKAQYLSDLRAAIPTAGLDSLIGYTANGIARDAIDGFFEMLVNRAREAENTQDEWEVEG